MGTLGRRVVLGLLCALPRSRDFAPPRASLPGLDTRSEREVPARPRKLLLILSPAPLLERKRERGGGEERERVCV